MLRDKQNPISTMTRSLEKFVFNISHISNILEGQCMDMLIITIPVYVTNKMENIGNERNTTELCCNVPGAVHGDRL